MEFNVGDFVRIRNWEEMAGEYGMQGGEIICDGVAVFLPEMRNLCGREFVILKIDNEGRVEGISLDDNSPRWVITTSMIELVEEIELEETDSLAQFMDGIHVI